MFVTENTFTSMYSTLVLFPLELPLFMREYRSGLYSTHLYYLSKMAAMVSRCSVVSSSYFLDEVLWPVPIQSWQIINLLDKW
jgi:hypothetical protein